MEDYWKTSAPKTTPKRKIIVAIKRCNVMRKNGRTLRLRPGETVTGLSSAEESKLKNAGLIKTEEE